MAMVAAGGGSRRRTGRTGGSGGPASRSLRAAGSRHAAVRVWRVQLEPCSYDRSTRHVGGLADGCAKEAPRQTAALEKKAPRSDVVKRDKGAGREARTGAARREWRVRREGDARGGDVLGVTC
eukprot:gene15333-biopygen17177